MVDVTKYISADPKVMMGKPVITGTRLTVELVLDKLGAGESVEQLLEAHPRLTKEAIFACLLYASQMFKTDETYLLAS